MYGVSILQQSKSLKGKKLRQNIIAGCLVAALSTLSSGVFAGSDAAFPKDWQAWPITHSGTIPGSASVIAPDLPPIVKETFKTYNWVDDGKGSAYNVRLSPQAKGPAAARNGKFADGDSAVLELTDAKVLLVTGHLLGEPQYGVYSYDGKDLSSAHPSLAGKVCNTCHSGYSEACVAGVCSK
jgi:hypothetical protein